MIVTLTPAELRVAALVGKMRHESAVEHSRRDSLGSSREEPHVLGAMGEMAYAKAVGEYWDCSVGRFKTAPDVGEVDVRTRSRDTGDLCVMPDDPDDRVVVLVTRRSENEFRVVGALRYGEGKRPEWRHEYGGDAVRPRAVVRFYVPQSALAPVTADELVTA